MLKYTEVEVTFAEIPNEITLCINISNCPCHCPGCHSKHLWTDIGEVLDEDALVNLMLKHKGVTCICFMGGDSDPSYINWLANLIRSMHTNEQDKGSWTDVKVAWYSGYSLLSDKINLNNFDYIKLGPYIEEYGPLNNPSTNQHLYEVSNGNLIDITFKFWKSSVLSND